MGCIHSQNYNESMCMWVYKANKIQKNVMFHGFVGIAGEERHTPGRLKTFATFTDARTWLQRTFELGDGWEIVTAPSIPDTTPDRIRENENWDSPRVVGLTKSGKIIWFIIDYPPV